MTQSDSSQSVACAGFLLILRWVSLASAGGSILYRRQHYIYFAMGFSLLVEVLNIRLRTGQKKGLSVEGMDEQKLELEGCEGVTD